MGNNSRIHAGACCILCAGVYAVCHHLHVFTPTQELHTMATMHTTWFHAARASTKHMHFDLLPCYGLLLV